MENTGGILKVILEPVEGRDIDTHEHPGLKPGPGLVGKVWEVWTVDKAFD